MEEWNKPNGYYYSCEENNNFLAENENNSWAEEEK